MGIENLTLYLTVFTGFFAIMNPFTNTSIFLSLVQGRNKASQVRIAKIGSVTAYLIVICFIILGKYIFQLFDITIPSFKISGGILLFVVGFDVLRAKANRQENLEEVSLDESIAISPLAIPVMAGPGVIVTAMNSVTDANILHTSIVILIFSFNLLLTYFAFIYSDKLVDRLGQNLIQVLGKIMGFILSIMGTGMAVEGIKLAFNVG